MAIAMITVSRPPPQSETRAIANRIAGIAIRPSITRMAIASSQRV